MAFDIVDLQGFYASSLGRLAFRGITRIVRRQWTTGAGMSFAGLGYATPYLDPFRQDAIRTLALMPARQGVVNWPTSGRSASALIEPTSIPLPTASIDRVLVAHALEFADQPQDMLEDIWRILTPGGRLMVVAPSRSGLWARVDTTPFGWGQPYSRSQLRELLRETLFSPVFWDETLYAPPFANRLLLRLAPAIEQVGAKLSLPGAGILVVEATKQLFRPVTVRRAALRPLPRLAEPVLVPGSARG
jgi:SAM-dependent methyltransferase